MLFDLELVSGEFGFDMVYPRMEKYGENIPEVIKQTLPSKDKDVVWDSAEFERGEFKRGTDMWDLLEKKLPPTSWVHRGFSVWMANFNFQTPDGKQLHIHYDMLGECECELVIDTDSTWITFRYGPLTDYKSVKKFFDENKEFIRNHLYGTDIQSPKKRSKWIFGLPNLLSLLGR